MHIGSQSRHSILKNYRHAHIESHMYVAGDRQREGEREMDRQNRIEKNRIDLEQKRIEQNRKDQKRIE